jgi:two-component system, NarL family, response regulator YdfI
VIRVFIVAPSSLARSNLETLVARRDVKVVAAAADFESLTDPLSDTEPDVILVDASGEWADSILETLASSEIPLEVPVVALTDQSSADFLTRALRSGVRAMLPITIGRDQVFAALQAATAGLVILHPQELNAVFPVTASLSQPLAELAEPLTRREREVLRMLASGLANKEIAARLNISDHTVKFHVASLLGKLGASSRTEAVTLGIRRGLVLL